MTIQPSEATTPTMPIPPIPKFEDRPVDAVVVKITGKTPPINEDGSEDVPVLYLDDAVLLLCEYRVVGVRHVRDAKIGVVREQILQPVKVDRAQWNPGDPADDGILRGGGSHVWNGI